MTTMAPKSDLARRALAMLQRGPCPFHVGDAITFQVPGDPAEGPYPVVGVSWDDKQKGWWATIRKSSGEEVLIFERIITEVHHASKTKSRQLHHRST